MNQENQKQASHGIGPQHKKESLFKGRMRFHQSWYRANVLNVPWGTGPEEENTGEYGNMLKSESGRKGLNFLTPEIFEAAKDRMKDPRGKVESYRLLHNMLSSQPMCFNLFGLLTIDYDFAADIFKRILPVAIQKVTNVKIEYAPEPASEYLCDRTSFDAFVEFVCADGKLGFVGIETKLTEPFSQNKRYDAKAYRRWSDRKDSPWPESSWPYLSDIRYNQLWRDHLLAVAMKEHPSSQYSSGFFMLVCHPEDGDCLKTVDVYKKLLKPGDNTFLLCSLDKLMSATTLVAANSKYQQWVIDFKRRYLQMELSEREWKKA